MIHDENKDVHLLSKVCKIDLASKTIRIKKDQIIGNRRWGRIDYLCNHRGFRLIREDSTVITNITTSDDGNNRKKRDKHETKYKKNNRMMLY